MKKKVILATGGTGGHIFPALATAQQLTERDPEIEVLFTGGNLGSTPFFQGAPFPFGDIPCATLGGGSIFNTFQSGWKICRGVIQCVSIIRKFQPDLIIGFGSFHAFPMLLAARLTRTPFVLHEGDAIPGKVTKFFSSSSEFTGVPVPSAMPHLKGTTKLINIPLRKGFKPGELSADDAKRALGLDPYKFTFLVFGGSQGAQALNRQVTPALTQHLDANAKNFQVIHLTGNQEQAYAISRAYSAVGINAMVKPFEEKMHLVWTATDMAICRAGATTVAEIMAFQVPSILVPYPRATNLHQDRNADFIEQVVGGGVKILEGDLRPEVVAETIRSFLANDRKKLLEMKRAFGNYKERQKPNDFCSLVLETVEKQ
jgi:UDP-N-acetylglucosamine--N-acetylmuramyl-(pentapeptide) pyrophosphoryl-undecaprenol N-acetylglucosamine transferase